MSMKVCDADAKKHLVMCRRREQGGYTYSMSRDICKRVVRGMERLEPRVLGCTVVLRYCGACASCTPGSNLVVSKHNRHVIHMLQQQHLQMPASSSGPMYCFL
eukprot:365535-Chlamydomonas_euryale.AAC.46